MKPGDQVFFLRADCHGPARYGCGVITRAGQYVRGVWRIRLDGEAFERAADEDEITPFKTAVGGLRP